ncbi:MAG: ABC-F family ATP-binding cassette domain-containing protein [Anaerolineales bacterium]
MLTAHRLSKSFELQTLFENASFSLNPGERTGLVGPNGCGKTTLMRILVGIEAPTSGYVSHDPQLRIGYLPQGFEPDPSLTLEEIISRHTGDISNLLIELTSTAESLAKRSSDQTIQARYDELIRRIQMVDTSRTVHILAGLGLDGINHHLPVGRLSGGQQTRLSLALVLLDDPELLLLDEPTNHLDISMLEWLESWLTSSPCTTLIISHDRTFLDHTVSHILEMDQIKHSVREYAGNYSDYLAQRQTELEHQWNSYTDQQAEIRRMRQDIIRTKEQAAHTERQASSIRIGGSDYKQKGYKSYQQGIAKKVAKKAKSRQKKLNRYLDSEEHVEKPLATRKLKLEFNLNNHLSHSVIRLEDLSIGYDHEHILLNRINLDLHAGQRIALTGPNGCGKTTLLRTITGQIPTITGEVHLSTTAHLGYLAQDQSGLNLAQTPVEMMLTTIQNETEARSFLAYFLFTGDEPLKPVSLLSYGQRTRLLLAKLVADGCNCLLLDEPINHLDIPSRTQFEQALSQFGGSVLAVVHDRYFIKRFADEIWWVENGTIRRAWEVPPTNPA